MRRLFSSTAMAITGALVLTLHASAQTTKTKTKIEAEHAKTVTYMGCVQNGSETRSYVLQNVVPITTTRTTGTGGTVTTTTYALVPEEKVELLQSVGHRVEITGVLIPAGKGEAEIKTKTKSKGSEEETKTEIQRGPMPQLRVISVKNLSESCS